MKLLEVSLYIVGKGVVMNAESSFWMCMKCYSSKEFYPCTCFGNSSLKHSLGKLMCVCLFNIRERK